MSGANLTTRLSAFMAPLSDPIASIDLSPKQMEYPFYFVAHRAELIPGLSDKYVSLLLPIFCYWGFSMVYHLLDTWQHPFFEKYRIHEPEEVTKRNRVSKAQVVKMVFIQQLLQTAIGLVLLEDDAVGHAEVFADHKNNIRNIGVLVARVTVGSFGTKKGLQLLASYGTQMSEFIYWWGIPAAQFWWSFFVMDAWQYFWHRAFHESRFLYRHLHSHHHRLYVPYAFGALYNHPIEGLLLDSLGALISHMMAFMTVRQAILLFAFSTLKTVDDHGGYAFPWWIDPLHLVFPNTSAYHDVHHQMQGLKFNYSQPFFVHFDTLFGTRMSADKFKQLKAARAAKKGLAEDGADLTDSAAAIGVAKSTEGLRKRDAAPKAIVATEKDPLVTTDEESYKRKAGTALS